MLKILRFFVPMAATAILASAASLGPLGSGVAAYDSRVGQGYLLFNPEGVGPLRIGHSGNAPNFIAVIYQNDAWYYDDNNATLKEFTPEIEDVLVAEIDFSANTVNLLSGESGFVSGISYGYIDGDLSVTPQQWNGASNDGEFGLAGNTLNLNTEPLWWYEKSIVDLDATDIDNKSVANLGQAKWMVLGAFNTVQSQIPDLAAEILEDLVGPSATHPFQSWPPPNSANDKKPLLVGQLKAIAGPFYEQINNLDSSWLDKEMQRLQTRQPGTHFPWGPQVGEIQNKGVANIGQLKAVFSLRYSILDKTIDSDSDSLPDSWERALLATLGSSADLSQIDPYGDFDGDYRSNLEEFSLGLSGSEPENGEYFSPIQWRNGSRAVIGIPASEYGSSIEMSEGVQAWYSGAFSMQLMHGDGAIRFRLPILDPSSNLAMCGLSTLSSGNSYREIDYSFYRFGETVQIYENGTFIGDFGIYPTEATFEIRRSGSIVTYLVNGSLVRTSTISSIRPLFADCSLGSLGSKISHAGHYGFNGGDLDLDGLPDVWELSHAPNLSILDPSSDHDRDFVTALVECHLSEDPFSPNQGTSVPLPIVWENLSGVSADFEMTTFSSSILKTNGDGWNAGANSVGRINGDGSVLFRLNGDVDKKRMLGLSTSSNNEGYHEIDYAMYIYNGLLRFYENGAYVGAAIRSSDLHDTFEIRRTGDTISYHKNGELLRTSAVMTTASLLIDTSLYSSGASIDSVAAIGLTMPDNADTDSDDAADWLESLAGWELNNSDTDGDGLSDGYEIFSLRSSPLDLDSDGDFMPDSWEIARNLSLFDPTELSSDFDVDGLPDHIEFEIGSDPSDQDTDDDYVQDGIEYYGTQ